MRGFSYKLSVLLLSALASAFLLSLLIVSPTHAGDPDEIIGPMNIDLLECIDRDRGDDTKDGEADDYEVIDIEEARREIKEESVGNLDDDVKKLYKACRRAERTAKLEHVPKTKIEGFVYEFHPDPNNPGEWFAVPSRDVPVVAEGVTFEIFWGSEPDGYFYFYKTRFGEGPIVLNLRLPEDAHPINPNILIESTGTDETWTVFLGFYRGDTPPPHVDQLKTPGGNFLPFGSSKFESIVGLDGKSALPGVGGVLPHKKATSIVVLAAVVLIVLPTAGIIKLRRKHTKDFES